jgi:hypothetical protein
VIGRHHREAMAWQLDAPHLDFTLEVHVVEMQHRKDSGVGPASLQVRVEVDALEFAGEDVLGW